MVVMMAMAEVDEDMEGMVEVDMEEVVVVMAVMEAMAIEAK